MDMEKRVIEGGLAGDVREAKALEIRAEGLLKSVRIYLNPVEKIEELEIDVALSQMTDLFATWRSYVGLLEKIARAKKILGREE